MASLPAASPDPRPLSSKSGRVKAARRLARRNSRAEHRLFLAEGAKALTEALHAGGVVEVFATLEASEQYAALRKAVDDAGMPWLLADDDAIASLSGAVTPQGIVATCRFLDVPLLVRGALAASRDHLSSSSAPTSATPATPAP